MKVAEIERIRYAHFREGLGLRELARTFHHSRKTIRKALEDPGPWSYRRVAARPAPPGRERTRRVGDRSPA
jgi:hypothetical protein